MLHSLEMVWLECLVCHHTSGHIGERVTNRVGRQTWGWDKQGLGTNREEGLCEQSEQICERSEEAPRRALKF